MLIGGLKAGGTDSGSEHTKPRGYNGELRIGGYHKGTTTTISFQHHHGIAQVSTECGHPGTSAAVAQSSPLTTAPLWQLFGKARRTVKLSGSREPCCLKPWSLYAIARAALPSALRTVSADRLLRSAPGFATMPAVNGERLVTFEEGEEESEYGYVRKVWRLRRSVRLVSLAKFR